MLRHTLWWALALAVVAAGCHRRAVHSLPPAPPPPPPDAGTGQLAIAQILGGDGGVSTLGSMIGRGGGRDRQRNDYPDWPQPGGHPHHPRGLIEIPRPPSDAGPNAIAFDRKLRVIAGLLRHCYERALLAKPALAGDLTLEVSVGADGKVLSLAMPGTALGEEIPSCLRAHLPRVKFPSATGEPYKGAVTVKLRPAPPAPDAQAPP